MTESSMLWGEDRGSGNEEAWKKAFLPTPPNPSPQSRDLRFDVNVPFLLEFDKLRKACGMNRHVGRSLQVFLEVDLLCREGVVADRELDTLHLEVLDLGLDLGRRHLLVEHRDSVSEDDGDDLGVLGSDGLEVIEHVSEALVDRRCVAVVEMVADLLLAVVGGKQKVVYHLNNGDTTTINK